MNDLTMTVTGWVATDPKLLVGSSGVSLCSFRLASTSRYFDREKGEWVDGRTEWFSVRVFRAAALLINKSIAKGQPVTVTGRFRTNEWEADSGKRTDLIIDATSVGHDLTRGIATFSRATGDESEARTAAANNAIRAAQEATADGAEGGDAELDPGADLPEFDGEAESDADREEATATAA